MRDQRYMGYSGGVSVPGRSRTEKLPPTRMSHTHPRIEYIIDYVHVLKLIGLGSTALSQVSLNFAAFV